MDCMKCGREIPASQVFCDRCLEVMQRYPVKSDAPIHLPNHRPQVVPKKPASRRRQLSPEEQVPVLKRVCRRLIFCVVVLALLLTVAATVIFFQWKTVQEKQLPIGRNYTVDTTERN